MQDETNVISINRIKEICGPLTQGDELKMKSSICHFDCCGCSVNEIQKEIRNHKIYIYEDDDVKHLWAFYGQPDRRIDEWVCIEVGSSDDIIKEICGIVKIMFETSKPVAKGSVLHPGEKIYTADAYADKVSCKYRHMKTLFESFWWIELNVNDYQIGNNGRYNKTNYAEVLYAVKKKALVWNPAPAFTDRRNRKNQEGIILEREFGI